MKTIQQDLKSNNLSLNEAIDVAQNRPLWRLMSTFGATHLATLLQKKKGKKLTNLCNAVYIFFILEYDQLFCHDLMVSKAACHPDYVHNVISVRSTVHA